MLINIVPGLIGIILTMTMMIITSMAVVRERETGTLEQSITTPIRDRLMIGKIIPFIILGYIQTTFALTVGHFLFKVPIRGSLLLLYGEILIFMICYLGLGLVVSTIAKTQQQAMQLSFFIYLPTLLLAGFYVPERRHAASRPIPLLLFPLTYQCKS